MPGPYDQDEDGATTPKPRDGRSDNPGGTIVTGPSDGRGGIYFKRPGAAPTALDHDPRDPSAVGVVHKTAFEKDPRLPLEGRAVEPTTLPYDPREMIQGRAVMPTRLDYNPHAVVGSTLDLAPWHVLKAHLTRFGCNDRHYVMNFIYHHGRSGSTAPQDVMKQFMVLAHFGDGNALACAQYAQTVAESLASQAR